VNNATTALVVLTVGLALANPARLAIQHQQGTLNWDREAPVLVAAPLITVSLLAITTAGTIAQSIIPPLVVAGAGIGLLYYTRWVPSPASAKTIRRIGYAALIGAVLYVAAAVLAVIAR
jgi:hypothetical protein